MKKYLYLSVFILLTSCSDEKLTDAQFASELIKLQSCAKQSDCKLVETGCGGCLITAINSSNQDELDVLVSKLHCGSLADICEKPTIAVADCTSGLCVRDEMP